MSREKHNAYMKVYSKETYYWHKEMGICTICGKREAMAGFTRCPECTEKGQEMAKEYYKKNKAIISKKNKDYKDLKVQNGICRECTKPLSAKSKHLCDYHLRVQAERARKKRAQKGAISDEVVFARGLCYFCRKNKACGEKNICIECADKKRKEFELIRPLGLKKSKENGWNWRK